jgi:hypothetical protein
MAMGRLQKSGNRDGETAVDRLSVDTRPGRGSDMLVGMGYV